MKTGVARKKLYRSNWFDYVNVIFMILLSMVILYPFYNSILVSFTPESDYIKTPFMIIPVRVTLDSYRVVLKNKVLFTGFGITTLVTIIGVVYNMLMTVFMAYSFNKEFPGKKFFLYAIIFTMFFNGGLIPFYLLIKDLNLMDSIFSMILPTGVSITYMTVMRKYFAALPEELQESARLDGASEFVILFWIILPLALPMVVTFALYYGIERWNEWWNGMLFIKSPFKQPLQLVLRGIIQSATSESMSASLQEAGIVPFSDGLKMASVVITMTPIMCLYPFLQKYFVQGLAIGAVKG